MEKYVVIAALVMSIASFIVYVIAGFAVARAKLKAHADALGKQTVTPSGIADIIEAVTKFADSLSKAGPALTSVIASILFLLIAAIASGAIGVGQVQGDATARTTQQHDAPNHAQ